VDDGTQPGGIERAAEQGIDAFEAQQFPDPMPAASARTGPLFPPGILAAPPPNDLFTRPFVMQGAFYVTPDRRSWWNGVMWVPGRPPGSSAAGEATTPDVSTSPSGAAPLVVFLVGLAVMAAIAFIAWQAFQAMPNLTPGGFTTQP
jgi:hypothetical protein